MPRIRTIKPEFWTDSKTVGLSPLARLLFIGAWNFADDYGALEPDAMQLKLRVLPAEQCDPDELVTELINAGLLVTMTNGAETFWHVAGWEKHQKVDRRSTSQYGDPESWTPAGTSPNTPEPSAKPAESPRAPSSPRPGREGIKEGNGEEGEREGKAPSSRKRADRAHRLPDGWEPAPEPELVQAVGGPKAAARELAKFGDYWRAAPGAKGRKVDWQATWRNWLRRAAENTSTRSSGADPPARPIREYDPDDAEDRFRALTGDAQ